MKFRKSPQRQEFVERLLCVDCNIDYTKTSADEILCEIAHAILGVDPISNVEMLFTAYPGKLTASIAKFPNASLDELRALKMPFAVKSIQPE